MRIWDVSPGYLSRQRLLGEHRELHGLASILEHGKTGYSHHPETKRWVGALSGLILRHEALAAEMHLRGYVDATPLERSTGGRLHWPRTFVTPPFEQFGLLRQKYADGESGRIPLPANAQDVWAHHKYSVMARDPEWYRETGRRVAAMRRGADFGSLCAELVIMLRRRLSRPRAVNALEHMWGHVARHATGAERIEAAGKPEAMFRIVRVIARRVEERYLLQSTALADLAPAISAALD